MYFPRLSYNSRCVETETVGEETVHSPNLLNRSHLSQIRRIIFAFRVVEI